MDVGVSFTNSYAIANYMIKCDKLWGIFLYWLVR